MRAATVLVVLAALAVLVLTLAEPFGPQATLDLAGEAVGRATPVTVRARDRGTGLAHVELRLIPATGAPAVVAAEDFPRRSLGWPWTVDEQTVQVTLDAATAHVPEGPATLEVWARDHSWIAGLHRGPRVVRTVTVDVTPPSLEVLSTQHIVRLGGSECAVYRVGGDAVTSGVQVGTDFFPGTAGLFADPALRAALFAVPQDAPDARPLIVAADAAGNRRTTGLDVEIRRRTFAEKSLPITDDFLARKVPELLEANHLDAAGDLVAGYLRINRELRTTTEARVREMCRDSAPRPLWSGALLRLPNSAPLSGFADRRSYVYGGQVIDRQTHLGFDLASLRGSPIPAAAAGRVVFAGPLGIYGNAVVLDHGLGLSTLYGHLSTIAVQAGAPVARGDVIGNTGDTGLAAGDHLHFSTMIRGVHVDPVEWWDAHWIHDHVDARLAAYPLAGGPS
jgi:murein DD-endopeptidase MepM/ murein hydrolase activator NlpD